LSRFIYDLKRTHYAGSLDESLIGQDVVLMGWVNNRRDHGGCIFIDLRDREGIVQVMFDPKVDGAAHTLAGELRGEFVVAIAGKVLSRGGNVNPRLKTGMLEVAAGRLEIFSRAKTPPFPIEDDIDTSEEVRLTYRYLDLRRPNLQKNLMARHRFNQITRTVLDSRGFLELETPFLIKSTPEGARDYVVPSRVHPGQFFALPQSPQLFKQLFMVSGFDRYFQITRCFRDEDLRAERQPEFTQVDVEMSFCSPQDVQDVTEEILTQVWQELVPSPAPISFARITWDEAMNTYGSDAPDIRFGLKLQDLSSVFAQSGFKVFADVLAHKGMIKAIALGELGELSRKALDDAGEVARRHGANGLAWAKIKADGTWQSPIAKFLSDQEREAVTALLQLKPGQTVVFVADQPHVVHAALGAVRKHFSKVHALVPANTHAFVWVTDFPLFEWHAEKQIWTSAHHPFTAPYPQDAQYLTSDPGRVRAQAYDITLNGVEIGGGSIRIHDRGEQEAVFAALGIGQKEAQDKFGFLLDALGYGAPPHGGVALGVDRICMQICGTPSIRDVIAFPKTQKQTDLMLNAPAPIDPAQLQELALRLPPRPEG
jgi:aspartyl-tRNA synthetase